MHPRNLETKEPYSWWDAEIKFTPLMASHIKKSEWVTSEAKSMSLGQVLFLHCMKAFAYLFLLFTILNLPLMLFYVNGAGPVAKERV